MMRNRGELASSSGYYLIELRGISQRMYGILLDMLSLTMLADEYSRNRKNKGLENTISIGREEVQHALLSCPRSQYPGRVFGLSAHADFKDVVRIERLALAELCRTVAAIYSDMVLYPLAWSTGVKPRLAARTRDIMQNSRIHGGQSSGLVGSHQKLLLWILWFACFAAFRGADQAWLEAQLLKQLVLVCGSELEGAKFEEVKEVLRGYLWWDHVCANPTLELWDRVRQKRDNEAAFT
jgi:hypothetical protein